VAGIGAGGGDVGWLIRAACQEVSELLESGDVEYRPGPAAANLVSLGHGKVTAPANARQRSPEDACAVAIPIDNSGRHIAHFQVRYPTPVPGAIPKQKRAQALAVAEMLGAAIARMPSISAN
jgi:hypothetical protein